MKLFPRFFGYIVALLLTTTLQAESLLDEPVNQYVEKNFGLHLVSTVNNSGMKCLDKNPHFIQPATDKKKLNFDCQAMQGGTLVVIGWKAAQETKASLQQAYTIFQIRDSKGILLIEQKFLCVPTTVRKEGSLVECSITFEVEKQKKTLNFSVFYFQLKADEKKEVFVLVSDKAENKKEEVATVMQEYISLLTKGDNSLTASKESTPTR